MIRDLDTAINSLRSHNVEIYTLLEVATRTVKRCRAKKQDVLNLVSSVWDMCDDNGDLVTGGL